MWLDGSTTIMDAVGHFSRNVLRALLPALPLPMIMKSTSWLALSFSFKKNDECDDDDDDDDNGVDSDKVGDDEDVAMI